MTADILIVDDEADIRGLIQGILQDEGYATRLAANSKQAYAEVASKRPDLVILDIWLQHSDHDGLDILDTLMTDDSALPVVMISGHGTIETAVSAIRRGAYDFIEKPFKSDRLLLLIRRALEAARLRRENDSLRQRVEGPSDLIGSSPVMSAARQTLERVAQTNSRVLLTGEPGTGKDVAARMIHRLSARASGPFMVLNCAILRPESLEVELFGQESGAPGLLERAHGGTLLLDEVADMPPETQSKIVRVLQEQKFHRVGGATMIESDVRVVASTSRDLESLVREGRFRQDLYYRLNVVPVALPPLRDHPQDIPALIDFLAAALPLPGAPGSARFSSSALAILQAYSWPGNVRQLRNVIEWVAIMGGLSADLRVEPDHLPPDIGGRGSTAASAGASAFMSLPLREAREEFERDYLQAQIKRFGGSVSRTAQFIGMERSALHRKLKQLGITGGEDDETSQDLRKVG